MTNFITIIRIFCSLEHNGIGFEKKLYSDSGEDKEFVLNAEYALKTEVVRQLGEVRCILSKQKQIM